MKFRLLGAVSILALALAVLHAELPGREYVVVLKYGQSIDALNKRHGSQTVRRIPNTSIYLIKTYGERILYNLRGDNGVGSAETNRRIRLQSSNQAALSSVLVAQMAALLDGKTMTTFHGTYVLKSYVDQPALAVAHVNEARSLSTGAGTRVGYIDTGVDFDHPALRPWLDPGLDLLFNKSASELDGLSQQMAALIDMQMATLLDKRFLFVLNQGMASLLDGGNDGYGFPSELGHGTLVAGIIHLVAPEARIVPIKAFDAYGNTDLFTIVDAIYKAKGMNLDVLNLSFSMDQDSPALQKALIEAQASGTEIVASAGNDASDSRNLYPAAYSQVIGVGATDFSDRLATFSNYGKSVRVTAPGAWVVSTVPGGKYAAAWGTSFSAPFVSGAVALLASSRGYGHSDGAYVVTTADSIDNLNPGKEQQLGKGRINVKRALTAR